MNRKNTLPENESAEHGEYAVRRTLRADLIALAVCLLLAVVTWLIVMNAEDTDYLAVEVRNPAAGCEYVLSVNSVEVEGDVVDLKRADAVGVDVTAFLPGTYTLKETDLLLPEGTHLADPVSIVLTVKAG